MPKSAKKKLTPEQYAEFQKRLDNIVTDFNKKTDELMREVENFKIKKIKDNF